MGSGGRFVRGGAQSHGEKIAEVEPQVEAVFEDFGEAAPPVAIIVASREEGVRAEDAERELRTRGIDSETHELSPTRDANALVGFVQRAAMRGVRVFIATAGDVPSLPAMVAAHSDLPVIGVPLAHGPLGGLDTLMTTAQAPSGMPVACMAVGGMRNAAIYASRVLNALPLPPRG